MSVNVQNMSRWLTALESGDYVQGKATLHDIENDTWCCLGVACSVAIDNGIDLERSMSGDGEAERFDGCGAYMPLRVQEWLGLRDGDGNPDIAGRSAVWWNDSGGLSFEGIAHLLRREYFANV